jgi:hypothetical protein
MRNSRIFATYRKEELLFLIMLTDETGFTDDTSGASVNIIRRADTLYVRS